MWGITGIDHIAKPGLLARVLAGSYPSGPSSAESPAIWKMIVNDEVAAYNVPSGILFDMHREVAARRAGVMTRVGLDTFVDPDRQGCAMNAAAREPIVHKVRFGGEDWLLLPQHRSRCRHHPRHDRRRGRQPVDASTRAPIWACSTWRSRRATAAASSSRRSSAMRGAGLDPDRSACYVPCDLVDAIVVDPDQMQTTQTGYDPAISGEIRRPLDSFAPPAFDAEKVIARRAAHGAAPPASAANLGFGISALRAPHPARGRPARRGDLGRSSRARSAACR